MTEPVVYKSQQDIALIGINHPPVNSLGLQLRKGIQSSFRQAAADQTIKAIILHSSVTGVFSAGADITEFESGTALSEPILGDLILEIEESSKPVIAAIDGVALGGGCELALACDYRVGSSTASVGLPEVNLGILPGAGGTQRMPRIAGVKQALDMIVSGKPVNAQQALKSGILDRLHDGEGDLLEATIEYAQTLLSENAPVKSCANLTPDIVDLEPDFFDTYRKTVAAKTKGFYAPERCVMAVQAACELPLADGLKKELALSIDCGETTQARALQHVFFAERESGKVPGVDPKTPTRTIKKVAVIGSGTMGGGIAMNYLNAGFETIILDLNGEALKRGIAVIRKNYERTVKKGRLSQEQYEQRMNMLSSTTEYADISDVDLVIEAVFEDMSIKQKVFKTLDETCKPGAILATNTSSLDVDEIAAITSRPQDVIGLHFFSPANVMPLLEIVRGKETADDVIVTTLKMARKIRKVGVVVGVCFGFVGNRILEQYSREGSRLILEGVTPTQLDKAVTDFGMAMGFCAVGDLAGLDVGVLVRESVKANFEHDPTYSVIMDRLAATGAIGQKAGKGFYVYSEDGITENPDVNKIATEAAAEFGIERREISDKEIIERVFFPMINEGVQVLDEGIASRASDIDLVYLYGYGFPRWRGGPMKYGEEVGLDYVLASLKNYREKLGEHGENWFKPAPLLEKLVAEGKSFKDLNMH